MICIAMPTVLKSQECLVGVATVPDLRKARVCGLLCQAPDRTHPVLSESRTSDLAHGKVSINLIRLITGIGVFLEIETPFLSEAITRIR